MKGSFHSLGIRQKKMRERAKTIRWGENNKGKRKKREKGESKGKGEKTNRGEPCVRGRGKREDFSTFRRLKVDGPRIKIGPRNKSYA